MLEPNDPRGLTIPFPIRAASQAITTTNPWKNTNLPAISKALDVTCSTLWGWINESNENRQRYDGARKEQDEMIRVKIDMLSES
mgnify:CR=1 FL=1